MSKMYFDFNVNLPDTTSVVFSPNLDNVCFYHPGKDISIKVENGWNADFYVESGKYHGRFKGLSVMVDGSDAKNHDWEEMSDNDFTLLKEMVLSGITVDVYNASYSVPLKVSNLELEILHGDEKLEFKSENPDLYITGDGSDTIEIDNRLLNKTA